jgi:ribonuclease HI
MATVTIYTDGSCRANGTPNSRGAWAAILCCGEREKQLVGGEAPSTNQRMELMAAIAGLEALRSSCQVTLVTDSQYVKNGITTWIKNWKRSGWISSKKQPVVNRDLWERLDSVVSKHTVTWEWVKGHAVDDMNNRVNDLAQAFSALSIEKPLATNET